MDELDPRLRSLLDGARDADDPNDADAARVRAAIAAALARPDANDGQPASPTRATSSGGATSLLKWLPIGVAALGVIAASFALRTAAPPETPAMRRAPAQSASAPAAPAKSMPPAVLPAKEPPAVVVPSPEPAIRTVDAAIAPRVVVHRSRQPAKPRAPAEIAQPAEAEPASAGPSELTLIRSATGALRDRQADTALQLLDQHSARYPEGILSEERRGLRVLALCALGRTDQALVERERFLSKSPHSPLAGRVRAACNEPQAP